MQKGKVIVRSSIAPNPDVASWQTHQRASIPSRANQGIGFEECAFFWHTSLGFDSHWATQKKNSYPLIRCR